MKKIIKPEKKKIEKIIPKQVVTFSNLLDGVIYLNAWVSEIETKINEIIDNLNER